MQRLSLVPTPIGNLGDITERALSALRDADVVAAEDTRRTKSLLQHYGIVRDVVRLDAHTMAHRAPRILADPDIEWLVYVSDAGTPGISDPGADLLALAVEHGVKCEVLPGATAFVPALVLSGLSTARFTFEGFLPRKGSDRKRRLQDIADATATSIVYESPHRVHQTLKDLAVVCGQDRLASVSREISKKFEETQRGTLSALADYFAEGTKGEVVVVISPVVRAHEEPTGNAFSFDAIAAAGYAAGLRGRDLRDLLIDLGAPRNVAYALVTATQNTGVDDVPENNTP